MRQRVVYWVMIEALVGLTSISAQEVKRWTLNDCIEYALEKNIQLQQSQIAGRESEVDVKSARAALFPNLSFNTGQNVTNRPYQEKSSTVSGTEIISSNNKTTYNGSYGLNAQWTLWDGNQRRNTLKQKKASRQIAELEVAQTANSLQEQIAQLYIQVLYAEESVKVNRQTLEVSQVRQPLNGEKCFFKRAISLKPIVPNWRHKSVMTVISWCLPKMLCATTGCS